MEGGTIRMATDPMDVDGVAQAADGPWSGAPEGTVVFLEPESAPGRSAHLRALRSGWTVAPVLTFTRRRPLAVVVDELIDVRSH